jgi:hypothetical protein
MKEKLFFLKIKHSPTIIRHILSRRWACPSNSMRPSRVVPLQTAPRPAFFAVDRSTFSICRWRSTIRLSAVGINRVTIIFVCGTSFHLYSLHFCIEQDWIADPWNGKFPFCRMRPGFYLSVILELVCCSLLVISTIMADDPAPKRARRFIGTVCEACGKHFDTSDDFDKHRTSGYLVGTPCHFAADNVNRYPAKAETCSTNAWYTFLSNLSTYLT